MMYGEIRDIRLLRIASIGFVGMLAISFAVGGYVIGVRSVVPVERASADRIVLGDLECWQVGSAPSGGGAK